MTLNERNKLLDTVVRYIDHLKNRKNIRIKTLLDKIRYKLLRTNLISNWELEILLKFMVVDSRESQESLRDLYKPLTKEFVQPVSSLEEFFT